MVYILYLQANQSELCGIILQKKIKVLNVWSVIRTIFVFPQHLLPGFIYTAQLGSTMLDFGMASCAMISIS